MKNMMWMKKGILCGLIAVCFAAGASTFQAEAGWTVSAFGKEAISKSGGTKTGDSHSEDGLKKKREELGQLQNTAIDYFVTCSYCNGEGRSKTACKKCGGSGIADIPGNLSLVMSCGYCMGSRYEKCSMCMGGKMKNPNYSEQCNVRNARIRELENEIAKLEQKLRPKETQTAQNTNQNQNGHMRNGEIANPGYMGDDACSGMEIWEPQKAAINCTKCKNTGWVECSLCGGQGFVEKIGTSIDLTGNGGTSYTITVRCTACTGGSIPCYLCSGRR